MIEKSKETNDSVLEDLQNEIKSLKSLIVNRMSINNQAGSSSPSVSNEAKSNEVKKTNEIDSSMSSRFPFINQKPAIPAWQMQGSSSTENKENDNE